MSTPSVAPAPVQTPKTHTVSLPLETARIVFLLGFVAIPVLSVRMELTSGLLVWALLFGIASIISWSKVPS